MKPTRTVTEKPYLTRQEAADLLGVSQRTIRNWELKGILPSARLNYRMIRYRRSDIEALIERRLSVGVPGKFPERKEGPANERHGQNPEKKEAV